MGENYDHGNGVAVDASGNVLVTGSTRSSGWTSGGFDTSFNGAGDAFVARIADPQAPTADAGGPYDGEEGSAIYFDAGGSTTPDAGSTLQYRWDWDNDGNWDTAYSTDATIYHTWNDDQIVTVTVEVFNGYYTDTDTATVTIVNADPTPVIESVSATRLEGTPIDVVASATDPAGANDTLTYSYEVFKDGASTAFASGSGVDQTTFRFTPDDNGSYEIVLTVADEDGGADVARHTIAVDNVAPQLTSFITTSEIAEDGVVTIAGSIVDPGSLDSFEMTVDWGDGTSEVFVYVAGAVEFFEEHQYDTGGIFEINVHLADKDGGADTAASVVMATGARVHDGVLQVVGTRANDHVLISKSWKEIRVVADFLPGWWHVESFAVANVASIDVFLDDGNDSIVVASCVTVPTKLDGGAGDDYLKGGRGADVLLGGAGSDLLTGGQGWADKKS